MSSLTYRQSLPALPRTLVLALLIAPGGQPAVAAEEPAAYPAVWGLEFSPDGKHLAAAAGSSKESGAIVIWNVSDWKPAVVHFEERGGCDVSFSRDGKRLGFGTAGSRAGIIDVETGKLLRAWDAHENRVLSVAFTPDGKSLATASADRAIKLWDSETAALKRTFEGHTDAVYSIAISPDGTSLCSGGGDSTARLWDLRTGELKKTLQPNQFMVRRVGFSRDGQFFFTSRYDARTRIQDAATGDVRAALRGGSTCADLSPDNRWIVINGSDNAAQLFRLDLRTASAEETERIRSLIKQFENEDYQLREATSRELEKLGLIAEPQLREAMAKSADAEVRLRARLARRKAMSPEPVATLGGHRGDVEVVCFSPDGKLLATGCRGGDIKIWDVGTFQEVKTLHAPTVKKK